MREGEHESSEIVSGKAIPVRVGIPDLIPGTEAEEGVVLVLGGNRFLAGLGAVG